MTVKSIDVDRCDLRASIDCRLRVLEAIFEMAFGGDDTRLPTDADFIQGMEYFARGLREDFHRLEAV